MLIIGEDEENNATVSVRKQGESGKTNTSMKIEEFVSLIEEEVSKTIKQF